MCCCGVEPPRNRPLPFCCSASASTRSGASAPAAATVYRSMPLAPPCVRGWRLASAAPVMASATRGLVTESERAAASDPTEIAVGKPTARDLCPPGALGATAGLAPAPPPPAALGSGAASSSCGLVGSGGVLGWKVRLASCRVVFQSVRERGREGQRGREEGVCVCACVSVCAHLAPCPYPCPCPSLSHSFPPLSDSPFLPSSLFLSLSPPTTPLMTRRGRRPTPLAKTHAAPDLRREAPAAAAPPHCSTAPPQLLNPPFSVSLCSPCLSRFSLYLSPLPAAAAATHWSTAAPQLLNHRA
jgi:hypothetical protein